MLQCVVVCVAVSCSVLQCLAVCLAVSCSVLQCVAVCDGEEGDVWLKIAR